MSICYTQLNESPQYLDIPGGLKRGKTVSVRAVPKGDRLGVNLLLHAAVEGSEVAFHFNPRFEENTIVRNCSVNGEWISKDEERDGGFPIEMDKAFYVQIFCAETGFEVSVDGTWFCDFTYRYKVDDIRGIALRQDAIFTEAHIYDKLANPYVGDMFGHFGCGKAMRVEGYVPADADRFDFNVHPSEDLQGDHLVHFNPRLRVDKIVRNTKTKGVWGEEENDGAMVIKPDSFFTADVVCMDGECRMFVDEEYLCSFKHRDKCCIEEGCFLSVSGDVKVAELHSFTKLSNDHVTDLGGPMNVGGMVVVHGTIMAGAKRLDMNLLTSPDLNGDVALHLNPRMNIKTFILNAKQGSWQNELVLPLPAMFAYDMHFRLAIIATEKEFKIIGSHTEVLARFEHRVPIRDITHLYMAGDANYQSTRYLPAKDELMLQRVPGKIGVGSWISMFVYIKPDADKFEICLSNNVDGSSDLLHMSVTLGDGRFVMNTLADGSPGTEELAASCPFAPDTLCYIRVLFDKEGYVIFVDDQRIASFAHRARESNIQYIRASGNAFFYPITFT